MEETGHKEPAMDLTTWIALWVVATAIAVVLGYYRMTIGLHDEMGMRLGRVDQTEFYQRQQSLQRRVTQVDRYGITFTVVSAILAVVVVLAWALEAGGKG
jgi:hypothetical protein